MIQIRREPGEKGLIYALDELCFPGEPRPSLEGREWWVARDEGYPVAYGGLRELGYGMVYLCRAGVLEDWRGRGLQRRLIRARLCYGRAVGSSVAITYASHDNPHSLNNLVREGFVFFDPEWAWAGREFLYLQRDLT